MEHFSSFNFCNVFIVLLVIVSSCTDGEFSCTSGQCVPAPLVCDFKEDCEDGSDEEFCGMIVMENIVKLILNFNFSVRPCV